MHWLGSLSLEAEQLRTSHGVPMCGQKACSDGTCGCISRHACITNEGSNGVLTAGQSAFERLNVVGMSELKLSSSSSYIKAVLLGKNCSLTLIFRELKMASNTPLPVLVWNFVSCTKHTQLCASHLQRDCCQLHAFNQGQDVLYGTCAGVRVPVLHIPYRVLPHDIGRDCCKLHAIN